MMGYGEDKGIIPRTCLELFNRIQNNKDPDVTYRAEVSYIEIYNEKVRDLLSPKMKGNLKVREHPSTGPYVEDLSRLAVTSFENINDLMDEGNKARTVAATNMNETSSRSHAIFTVFLTQKRIDETSGQENEKVARISLVDLAGSERANSTGATGARLKEGANINRSLTTLGKVISGLAEQSINDARKGKKLKEVFIPYRDSVLTWLLKDSLGGNSKTAMIAAIAPADYDETLSTLRYADQAKKIQNKAVVNEDPNAKMIRELKDELENLRTRLRVYAPDVVEQLSAASAFKQPNGTRSNSSTANSVITTTNVPAALVESMSLSTQEFEIVDSQGVTKKVTQKQILDQLQSSERLLADLNETWEEKLKKTEEIQKERENTLEELGIAVHRNTVGVYAPKKVPHLVNLNEDPLMSECLMYQLKPGTTRVGRNESKAPGDIRLTGSNIQDDHCTFVNTNGTVTVHPNPKSVTMVNGLRIEEPKRLKSGYRIILGGFHIFRFNHPEEVRRERDLQKIVHERNRAGGTSSPCTLLDDEGERPCSPTDSASLMGSEPMDWSDARLEAMKNYYSPDMSFTGVNDDELEKLYDEIARARNIRKIRCESRTDLLNDDDDASTGKDSAICSVATASVVIDNRRESVYTESPIDYTEIEEKQRMKDEFEKEMRSQKKHFEAEIKRMSLRYPSGIIPIYTDAQTALLKGVLERWKKLRYVTMAESVLTHAMMLKEANIYAREMNKRVTYQFAIIEEGQFSSPVSSWEPTSGFNEFNTDEDKSLTSSQKPCIGVRVIDRKHQTMYFWSLGRLKQRLHKMQELYKFIDKPNYCKHLNVEDIFYENPCPKYCFIGSASVSVRNLALHQPYESCVEVVCRSTGRVKGKLRVLISPMAELSALERDLDKEAGGEREREEENPLKASESKIQINQRILFEIRMLELSGLSESEFSQVHVQFRLSSLGGIPAYSSAEKLFATDPASGFENGSIVLDYSQKISMTVTERVLDLFMHSMVSFEIYGTAQPRVLSQHERWDDEREKPSLEYLQSVKQLSVQPSLVDQLSVRSNHFPTSDTLTVPNHHLNPHLNSHSHSHSNLHPFPAPNRPEEELLASERHDIVAWVQVCELTPNGSYMPVQVVSQNTLDKGTFGLRQGLQRRISITLSHSSGKQFAWNRISKASIGRVRCLDDKGRIISSPAHEDVQIKLSVRQKVSYKSDGTSQLCSQGAWDSSQHDCTFLNRLTPTNSRILLQLKWEVEAEKCSKPIQFSMDIAVQVQGRDATGASRLRKLLGSSKHLTKCSGMFQVHLRPPMTRRVSQLWRLNTGARPIKGDECLGAWRPRGVSLVNDYRQICERIRRKEDNVFTSQVLTLRAARSQTSHGSMTKKESEPGLRQSQQKDGSDVPTDAQAQLLHKVLDLWTHKMGTHQEIVLSQDPPVPGLHDMERQDLCKVSYKLLAEVKLVVETDTVAKKGFMTYQEDPLNNKWVKRWFVMRRPYIYIYSNQSETDEQGVINISSVRVSNSRDMENVVHRSHIYALYTTNNAYILQATSKNDMIDWMAKLDPSSTVPTITSINNTIVSKLFS
ncbi:hypothetical protein J3Q64DRAFT_1760666 [Phycomyces blakesleeanus]|uniref:Kinesin-like protein unc-104 n=1 Tax=Phycomyces blakesleeanus TaxID=4837 RepID=A0ABR3AR13_PHYBL